MSMQQPAPGRVAIDPRGPRFTAAVTAALLALVLLTAPGAFATTLLGAQTALFAAGAAFGVHRTALAWVFRAVVRPRLAPPTDLEDAAPPRFAQAVGLVFAAVGLAGFIAGLDLLGLVATGLALVAALLNAVFGLCLGCEMYLLIRRLSSGSTVDRRTTVATTN